VLYRRRAATRVIDTVRSVVSGRSDNPLATGKAATARGEARDARVDLLVREHLPLVGHIVRQLAARYPRHVERDDLWSAGALGLVDAASRYDPSSGIPFSRYAAIRIRGAIIDSNRDRDWAPRSLRRHGRQIRSATERYEATHGRSPSAAQLAAALGLTEDDVLTHHADATRATVLHLDHPLEESDEPGSLGELIRECDEDALPEEALERMEMLGALREAIARLPEPHRTIVDRYYVRGHLLRDIAMDRGVTEARVSQLCLEAVHALRAFLGAVFDDVPAVPPGAPGRNFTPSPCSSWSVFWSWVSSPTCWFDP
jgi:RNA polymerase sigma factor FliA